MPPFKLASALFLAAALLLLSDTSGAKVIVFDRVAMVNHPVQLSVRTGGLFMPEGGQRVHLFVGAKRLKQILTGGDGYGYLTYRPSKTGLKTIEAVQGENRGFGRLVVVSDQEKVVLVDIESALRESALAPRPRQGGRQAVQLLNQVYRVVYLYTFTGLSVNRQWLDSNGLPSSAVLPWRNAAAIRALKRLGIHAHAIIGSASQVKAAEKTIAHRFSFEETQDGLEIDSWSAVFEALELNPPMPEGR